MKSSEDIVIEGAQAIIGKSAWCFIFIYVGVTLVLAFSIWFLSLLFGKPL